MSLFRSPATLRSLGLAGRVFLLLSLAMLGACGHRRAKAPDWVVTAPAPTVMALSGSMGWLLEEPQFQSVLERFPMAAQSLDLFLKRAKINPHQETGRISLYVLAAAPLAAAAGTTPAPSDFLLQLGEFRDQATLNVALNEAFPPEGSLFVHGRELPLFVVFDLNPFHIRVLVDEDGRVWLGDLRALAQLNGGWISPRNPILESAQWINGAAPFQGFLKPQGLLPGTSSKLPPEMARNLPQGIEALVWSVTPGTGPNALHRFELAITGSPRGILQVAPWLQRLLAAATALQGAPGQAPEILQESRRIGLRAQLTQEQVNVALSKLNQPGITFGPPAGGRRP